MPNLPDIDRLIHNHWLAGALGSLVALRIAPGASWWERAGNVACGLVCAGFLTPAAAEWWRIDSERMQAAIAFGVGLFGLSIAATAFRTLRAVDWASIVTGWASRRQRRK
jgi:hypothetical protein